MHNVHSPRTDDSAIEAEIRERADKAPRVTPADIEAAIASEHYFTARDGVLGATIDSGVAVNRFLVWPVPADVYPDGKAGEPGRTGTNLLTAQQAKEMLNQVTGAVEAHAPLGVLTFCVLVLKNGFTVTGESACASPENFDAEIGRKIARQNATNKIWPLLGFRLRDQLQQANDGTFL